MNRNRDNANIVEKDRIRSEIDAQIEAFLRAGGKIDVLHGNNGEAPTARGSVWRSPDDIPGMSQ
jgi:hypothetical protein